MTHADALAKKRDYMRRKRAEDKDFGNPQGLTKQERLERREKRDIMSINAACDRFFKSRGLDPEVSKFEINYL
jgi:hypothetical protein